MKGSASEGFTRFFLEPGKIYYSSKPAIVQTILGSCIAVTMHCPRLAAGAICHAMLPSGSSSDSPCDYVEAAIRSIFSKMTSHGANREELVVKLFGGSTVLNITQAGENRTASIGDQNIEQAVRTLDQFDLAITARDTGGDTGRKLFFHTATGDVYVRRQRSSPAKRATYTKQKQ